MKKVFHVPNCACCTVFRGDGQCFICYRTKRAHPKICVECRQFDEKCRALFFIQGWAIFAAGGLVGALVAMVVMWWRYG